MAYTFKLQVMEKPVEKIDGTGMVSMLIGITYSSDGINYVQVPGYVKLLYIGADYLKTVMDLPQSTAPERTAKNNAIKNLIKGYPFIKFENVPINDDTNYWTIAYITQLVTKNDAAKLQAQRLDTYIVTTLGMTYPVAFNL